MRQYAYVIQLPKRKMDSLWFLFAKTVNYTYIESLFYNHYINQVFYFNKRSRGGAGELFSYITVSMDHKKIRVRMLTRQLMWLIDRNKPQSKTNETKIYWQKYGF
jgi:hypothetical protein